MDSMKGLKWCSYHKEYHPVSEFGKNVTNKDGLHNWCKQAVSEWFAEKYKNDEEYRKRRNEDATRYYRENRQKMVERARERRKEYKEKNRKGG